MSNEILYVRKAVATWTVTTHMTSEFELPADFTGDFSDLTEDQLENSSYGYWTGEDADEGTFKFELGEPEIRPYISVDKNKRFIVIPYSDENHKEMHEDYVSDFKLTEDQVKKYCGHCTTEGLVDHE